MPTGTVAVGGAAVVSAGVGGGLFAYNRENFMYDAELRFQRFCQTRQMASAQVGQYREDLHGLTEMMASRLDVFHTIATLFMSCCAALSCAGRIGMHGAAPPGWLMGLYNGHIFTSLLYLGAAIWLGMHASLRAQCSMTSLLTRKVRMPVPSLAQIDAARTFGSTFELQKWGDVLRVPFTPHPHETPQAGEASSGDSDGGNMQHKKKTKKQLQVKRMDEKERKHYGDWGFTKDPFTKEFGSTARKSVPSWIRDEVVVDKAEGNVPAGQAISLPKDKHAAPEHFQLYAAAQNDWWCYDVNSRIALLLGIMNMIYAIMYYIIGTATAELRHFWIAWSTAILFCVCQACILRMDIMQGRGRQLLPHLEWAGHAAPYFAIAAETLELSYYYKPGLVVATWALVVTCYLGHFLFALRMLDLATPDSSMEAELEDEPGKSWWPNTWNVPLAFGRSLWLLAPPKKLERGQHCMIREMKGLQASGAGAKDNKKGRKGSKSSKQSRRFESASDLQQHVLRIRSQFDVLLSNEVQQLLSERQRQRVTDLYNQSFQPVVSRVEGNGNGDGEGFQEVADSLKSVGDAVDQLQNEAGVSSFMMDGGAGSDAISTGNKASMTPFWILRLTILTTAFCWAWMIMATVIECALGPVTVIKWPGEPPWSRDVRNRAVFDDHTHKSNQDLPDDYRLMTLDAHNDGSEPQEWPVKKVMHSSGGSGGSAGSAGSVTSGQASTSYGHSKTSQGAVSAHSSASSGSSAASGSSAMSSGSSQAGASGAASAGSTGSAHSGSAGSSHSSAGSAVSGGRRLQSAELSEERLSGRALSMFSGIGHGLEATSRAVHNFVDSLAAIELLASTVTGAQGSMGLGLPSSTFMLDPHLNAVMPKSLPSAPVFGSFMAPAFVSAEIQWPAMFEPRHLACARDDHEGGGVAIAAITTRGFGATVRFGDAGSLAARAEAVSFQGLSSLGSVVGTSWAREALRLVTRTGRVASCSAQSGSVWNCTEMPGSQLPVRKNMPLVAAAVSDRFAAMAYSDLPGQVLLFANHTEHGWHGLGEVHVPHASRIGHNALVSLTLTDDELLVASESGDVFVRQLNERRSQFHEAPANTGRLEWQSACRLAGGNITRLALQQTDSKQGSAWHPQLIL